MDIKYNVRHSKFLEPCEAAIRLNRDHLDGGGTVEIRFSESEDGLADRIEVDIRNGYVFGTDWQNAVESLFPARIKAAATALLNCGCCKRYVIDHSEGLLTIRLA